MTLVDWLMIFGYFGVLVMPAESFLSRPRVGGRRRARTSSSAGEPSAGLR